MTMATKSATARIPREKRTAASRSMRLGRTARSGKFVVVSETQRRPMTRVIETIRRVPSPSSIAEVKKLFALSTQLGEASEAVLERQGAYSMKFQRSIERSLDESRRGKAVKVASLRDLK